MLSAGEFQRHGAGELNDRRLGHGVGRDPLEDAETENGRDVDDRAAGSACPHPPAASRAVRNTPSRLTSITARHSSSVGVGEERAGRHTGGGDKNVDGPERFLSRVKRRATASGSVTSSGTASALSAFGFNLLHGLVEIVRAPGRKRDLGAGAGEGEGKVASKPDDAPVTNAVRPDKSNVSVTAKEMGPARSRRISERQDQQSSRGGGKGALSIAVP